MEKLREIIVVEGKSDTQRIQNIFQADTIETGGSALSEETLALIKKAQEKRGVIVFTDPDFPGEKIRKKISQAVPGVKHAFISQEEAKNPKQGSLGVEHASDESIRQALKRAACQTIKEGNLKSDIDYVFLNEHQLINGQGAKLRRQLLGEALHIGYVNGKQLKKRLDMFGISREEVLIALDKINKG